MDIYAHPYPPRDDLILGTSVTAVCAVVSIDGVFFFAALLSRVELDEESGGSNQGRRSTKRASPYGITQELERCQGQDEQRGTERKRTSGATTDSLSVMSSGIFSGLKAIQFIESGDLFSLQVYAIRLSVPTLKNLSQLCRRLVIKSKSQPGDVGCVRVYWALCFTRCSAADMSNLCHHNPVRYFASARATRYHPDSGSFDSTGSMRP